MIFNYCSDLCKSKPARIPSNITNPPRTYSFGIEGAYEIPEPHTCSESLTSRSSNSVRTQHRKPWLISSGLKGVSTSAWSNHYSLSDVVSSPSSNPLRLTYPGKGQTKYPDSTISAKLFVMRLFPPHPKFCKLYNQYFGNGYEANRRRDNILKKNNPSWVYRHPRNKMSVDKFQSSLTVFWDHKAIKVKSKEISDQYSRSDFFKRFGH